MKILRIDTSDFFILMDELYSVKLMPNIQILFNMYRIKLNFTSGSLLIISVDVKASRQFNISFISAFKFTDYKYFGFLFLKIMNAFLKLLPRVIYTLISIIIILCNNNLQNNGAKA